jgi:pilus assembly protein CpaE
MRPIVLFACPPALEQQVASVLDEPTRARLCRWSDPVDRHGTVSSLLTIGPAVVIIGSGLDEDSALSLAGNIDRSDRGISVVVVAEMLPRTMARALAAGARAVIPPNPDRSTLREALRNALTVSERKAEAQPEASPGPPGRGGRVVTVAAPKGGAGKTVIASNLAVGLAQTAPRGVVLVDLDLQFGDIAYALTLQPRHTIYDAATSPKIDPTALKVFLTHHQSDLYALCAPDDPARGEMIEADRVGEIISTLASDFDYLVIDTGAGLTEHTLTALDASTDAVLIADADVPSIRHLAKVAATLDRIGLDGLRRHFILNRADARIGVRIADVLGSLGLEMDLEIPTSREVGISLSRGVPIMISNPKSTMAKRVTRLVHRLADRPESRATGYLQERSA